jgi:hypothetical protein
MARTALTTLQDQIEAIRREAYAAGYAAAMQSIREFVARPAAPAAATPAATRRRAVVRPTTKAVTRTATRAAAKAPAVKAPAARKPGRPRKAAAAAKAPATRRRRPQRGTNARLIAEVLKAAGPGYVRPAVIRTALQRDKSASVAFTSIRHALGQLQTRGEVEASADGKTWRYKGPGG